MYFDDEEEERDPFELFGDVAEGEETDAVQELSQPAVEEPVTATTTIEPEQPRPTGGFSWAGFAGGLAAFVWIAGAIGGPLSYFGVEGVLTMDPAMQAGLIALALGPALLFWVASSAAGEALKARRLAGELTRIARGSTLNIGGDVDAQAQRITNTVKTEIEALNDAVASALDRLQQLETVAQRNAALFDNAVAASRENTEAMSVALRTEHDALMTLNGDMKGQTEVLAHSVGRQIRLMREASKIVKTEITAAEDALETHLAAFSASATVLGERTNAMHKAADSATHASASLNGTMTHMLDGLAEATRLTDSARQSTEQAVLAANETASAMRETTRSAVFEAKRAAQLIRAETVAMQEAANDTLARLQDAANAARAASEESQAAADRHAASLEKRLSALASVAGGKKAAVAVKVAERPAARAPEPKPVVVEEVTTLAAAANAAVARTSARPQVRQPEAQQEPRRVFKGFGGWGNFMPQTPSRTEDAPQAANEDFDLVDFRGREERNPDATLKHNAIDMVTEAGVDLSDVLQPGDLDFIARSSRNGAAARRQAVLDAAPTAVNRIARHVKRHTSAQSVAAQFRARPDLAKSENKGEGSDLVRAYLLIDAALA